MYRDRIRVALLAGAALFNALIAVALVLCAARLLAFGLKVTYLTLSRVVESLLFCGIPVVVAGWPYSAFKKRAKAVQNILHGQPVDLQESRSARAIQALQYFIVICYVALSLRVHVERVRGHRYYDYVQPGMNVSKIYLPESGFSYITYGSLENFMYDEKEWSKIQAAGAARSTGCNPMGVIFGGPVAKPYVIALEFDENWNVKKKALWRRYSNGSLPE